MVGELARNGQAGEDWIGRADGRKNRLIARVGVVHVVKAAETVGNRRPRMFPIHRVPASW